MSRAQFYDEPEGFVSNLDKIIHCGDCGRLRTLEEHGGYTIRATLRASRNVYGPMNYKYWKRRYKELEGFRTREG